MNSKWKAVNHLPTRITGDDFCNVIMVILDCKVCVFITLAAFDLR